MAFAGLAIAGIARRKGRVMTPNQLRRLFPGASASTIAANVRDAVTIAEETERELKDFSKLTQADRDRLYKAGIATIMGTTPALTLTIAGQIRGGKNAVQITRTGRRYPGACFARWKADAVAQLLKQLPRGWQAIAKPVNVRLEYFAGDRRRRDQPAVIDAIWHALEKAGVVTDDTHLWITESSRGYDKANPRAIITILP
jgi:Holliday junction resolvase RusA-like endonuclease